jgi:aquaporin Z
MCLYFLLVNYIKKIIMNPVVKYFAEFLGTFVFLSVILTVGEPIPVAVALLASIYLVGNISGAHVNPVVSVSMYLNDKLSSSDLGGFVVAQLLGGVAAVYFAKMVKK